MSARILVVDDEEPVSSMLKVVLEANGYAVVTSPSAADALRLLATEPFGVVLTDMKMETDSAGYDVVRAARALPDPPGVVILTAYPLLANDWRAAGADAAMSKPTQMNLLLEVVDELVQKRRDRTPQQS
jgi:CheY-like chemotaxis protein